MVNGITLPFLLKDLLVLQINYYHKKIDIKNELTRRVLSQ